jgi:tyrosine-protein kinase Etk/Wzc
VQNYQHRLDDLPSKAHKLAQLRRAAEVEEAILMMLHKRYEEARIEEAGVESRGRVIDPALAPLRPVRPRPLLSLILGVVFGVGLAFGACLASRPLQRYIDSPEMAHQLTGLKVLGQIPAIVGENVESRGHSRLVRRFLGGDTPALQPGLPLVLSHAHGSDVVEAYRSLRTMMQFSNSNGAPRAILVTSAGPGDGKTTTAANLAVTFAASGDRVLLIDADMRKPTLHHLFGLDIERGLREVLTCEIPPVEAIHRSTVASLSVMTAGAATHNPAELLGSREMTALIQQLKEAYRYVIIDSPPVLPVTDPAILSTRVDTTVFVVRDRQTPKTALEYAINVLRCLPIELGGIIYNEDQSGKERSSYYGGYGYGYRHSRQSRESDGKWVSEQHLLDSNSSSSKPQDPEVEKAA